MTNLDPDPIDRTHVESVIARERINEWAQYLKDQAAMWQPGPMASEWVPSPLDFPQQQRRR